MLNLAVLKANKLPVLFVIISTFLYAIFAYSLERTNYATLVFIYAILFFLFYKLLQLQRINYKFLVGVSFLFRAIFVLSIPNLSQDFYRFIWDGRLLLQGFNPYLYTPNSFIFNNTFPITQAQELYAGMGNLNASHYSNYPSINQLCFAVSAVFASKSILGSTIILRVLIIIADFGTLYFGKRLLENLNLPIKNIFWYILNPFIIIELTGNLHFEGVMIFFLVWSLYLLSVNKWKLAAIVFAFSIATKLVPLMFLPLFFWWFYKTKQRTRFINYHALKRLILFYLIIGITTILLFIPFFSKTVITNYSKTVGLWFGNFEFNASIYYVAREIGYLFRGWNEIAIIGKLLPLFTIVFILCLSFFKKTNSIKKLITAMLFCFSFYLFMSTTVHPWYVATLVFLSVFTTYKFPLVWSFVIVLSYFAYTNTSYSENLWLIALEYLIVYGVFVWEVFIKKPKAVIQKQL